MKVFIFTILVIAGRFNLFAGDPSDVPFGTCKIDKGWAIFMSIPTNIFIQNDNIMLTLVVSNASSVQGVFSWADGAEYQPGFGRLTITNADTGRLHVFCGKRIGFYSGRSGSFNPTQTRKFVFDIKSDYGITNSGHYTIGFVGQLRTMTNQETQFTITVPPLELQVKSK